MDTADNRLHARPDVGRIDSELAAGTREYDRCFPGGRKAALFAPPESAGRRSLLGLRPQVAHRQDCRLGTETAYDWRLIPNLRGRDAAHAIDDWRGFVTVAAGYSMVLETTKGLRVSP